MIGWVPLFLSIVLVLSLIDNLAVMKDAGNAKGFSNWNRVFVIYSALILCQLFLFPRLVEWNSPINELGELSLQNRPVNTFAILSSWVMFCCYWSFAWLTASLSREDIIRCMLVIAAMVLFQAAYGVIGVLYGQETILGVWPKLHYINTATGTFVNHNHLANFIAIGFPLAVIGVIEWRKSQKQPNGFGTYLLITATAFLVIAALVLSLSRMGVFIGGLGIVAIGLLIIDERYRLGLFTKLAIILGLVFIGTNIANLVGLDALMSRFERAFIYDMRWNIWPAMFELPKSMYFYGTGAGTFSDVFIQVHPPMLPKTAYYAHNEYLQLMLEFGFIGLTILSFAFYQWYKGNRVMTRDLISGAAKLGIILMAIHCIADFPMRIPANALLFWFCLGILTNPNLVNSSGRQDKGKRRRVKVRKRKFPERSTVDLGSQVLNNLHILCNIEQKLTA